MSSPGESTEDSRVSRTNSSIGTGSQRKSFTLTRRKSSKKLKDSVGEEGKVELPGGGGEMIDQLFGNMRAQISNNKEWPSHPLDKANIFHQTTYVDYDLKHHLFVGEEEPFGGDIDKITDCLKSGFKTFKASRLHILHALKRFFFALRVFNKCAKKRAADRQAVVGRMVRWWEGKEEELREEYNEHISDKFYSLRHTMEDQLAEFKKTCTPLETKEKVIRKLCYRHRMVGAKQHRVWFIRFKNAQDKFGKLRSAFGIVGKNTAQLEALMSESRRTQLKDLRQVVLEVIMQKPDIDMNPTNVTIKQLLHMARQVYEEEKTEYAEQYASEWEVQRAKEQAERRRKFEEIAVRRESAYRAKKKLEFKEQKALEAEERARIAKITDRRFHHQQSKGRGDTFDPDQSAISPSRSPRSQMSFSGVVDAATLAFLEESGRGGITPPFPSGGDENALSFNSNMELANSDQFERSRRSVSRGKGRGGEERESHEAQQHHHHRGSQSGPQRISILGGAANSVNHRRQSVASGVKSHVFKKTANALKAINSASELVLSRSEGKRGGGDIDDDWISNPLGGSQSSQNISGQSFGVRDSAESPGALSRQQSSSTATNEGAVDFGLVAPIEPEDSAASVEEWQKYYIAVEQYKKELERRQEERRLVQEQVAALKVIPTPELKPFHTLKKKEPPTVHEPTAPFIRIVTADAEEREDFIKTLPPRPQSAFKQRHVASPSLIPQVKPLGTTQAIHALNASKNAKPDLSLDQTQINTFTESSTLSLTDIRRMRYQPKLQHQHQQHSYTTSSTSISRTQEDAPYKGVPEPDNYVSLVSVEKVPPGGVSKRAHQLYHRKAEAERERRRALGLGEMDASAGTVGGLSQLGRSGVTVNGTRRSQSVGLQRPTTSSAVSGAGGTKKKQGGGGGGAMSMRGALDEDALPKHHSEVHASFLSHNMKRKAYQGFTAMMKDGERGYKNRL